MAGKLACTLSMCSSLVLNSSALSGPSPQQWEQSKTPVTESAKLTIGPKQKVHRNWFDENDERIKELLDDKKKAFIEW